MSKDQEIIQALMQGMMIGNPTDLLKMMQGTNIDLKATLEEIPLEISIRIKKGEILARVKIMEEKEEDGDQSET